jgi:hypothetical protein
MGRKPGGGAGGWLATVRKVFKPASKDLRHAKKQVQCSIDHPNARFVIVVSSYWHALFTLWTTCRGETTSWRPPARQRRLSPSTTSRPPRRRRSSRMRASARWFGWNGRSMERWRAPAGGDSTAAAWLQPGRSVRPPCESRRSTGDTWYVRTILAQKSKLCQNTIVVWGRCAC